MALPRHSFRYALPEPRLGQEHDSLEAFRAASNFTATKKKEYSLVVVTEPSKQRILLGQKHRGFGQGMYNSFGGKIEPGESIAESARRELEEETGISVPLDRMQEYRLGTHHFTFDDSPVDMIVHVFRINVSCDPNENLAGVLQIDSSTIRGCEEITPIWFDKWHDIPLDNMFADDTVWLTTILEAKHDIKMDGWFHFQPGGQETNSILHYYLNVRPKQASNGTNRGHPKSFTLEQRLFHKLHDNSIHSPSIKEFKECFAFVNAVTKFFGKKAFDVVIDVAGGHGALAALFLILTSSKEAVVIDPAQVGKDGVERAWGDFYSDKKLRYRHECLRRGLPVQLSIALQVAPANRILVLGCHACQHLSDEILEISCQHGVHAAVMPCCQKDTSPGSSWKMVSKQVGVPIAKMMDILLAGKVMSWNTSTRYDVRMKVIDETITPQNRLILCRALDPKEDTHDTIVGRAHQRLEKAYNRAHIARAKSRVASPLAGRQLDLASGFCFGVLAACAVFSISIQASRRG